MNHSKEGTEKMSNTLLYPMIPIFQTAPNPNTAFLNPIFTFPEGRRFHHRWNRLKISLAPRCQIPSSSNIDMVRNRDGVYAPKPNKVVVLWDLDNKPPRGPPFSAATSLKRVASYFGDVVEISAYANRHAFIHLPQWVIEERRERRQLDVLERKGVINPPPEAYVCSVCGRKCKTNLDLKKHFKQLHEREREKKLNRMKSLKGKKRQKFKEKYITGNVKYQEAARRLIKPKVGYGLAGELRRAGVYVKTVEDKPQAADWAVKRQMQHSLSRGVDWLFLVSDDSDFAEMLRRAKEANLGTVVIGDWDRALGRHADYWVSWSGVENGEVDEKELLMSRRTQRNTEEDEEGDEELSFVSFDGDGESDLDSIVNEIAAMRSEISGVKNSAFSEGEEEDDFDVEDDSHGDLYWDSENEESDAEDVYI